MCWSGNRLDLNIWSINSMRYESCLLNNIVPAGNIHGEKSDHLPGRGMGPLSIVCCVGEDHRQMESSCDVGGPKYPWPTVDGKMQSSRVGLSPRRYRVIKLDDYLRINITTQRHERLQMVPLQEEHGVSKLRVLDKCREIVVNLPVQDLSHYSQYSPGWGLQWK